MPEGEIERPDRSGASAARIADGAAFSWIDGQTHDTFENAPSQGQIASMLEVIESLDADPAGLHPLPRPLRHEACPGLALIAADVALHVDHVADTGKGHILRHTNPPRHKNKRPPAGGTPHSPE